MDAEPTSPPPLPCTEDHSTTLDEKRPSFSKELTSSEHAALETKDKSMSIKTFLPWLKKPSKDRRNPDGVESSKAEETPVPAPFLSLFRLDHHTFLTGISSSSMQVFNSL
jgi:hypothetical protein